MVPLSPHRNPAGKYNALNALRAFVDFSGDAAEAAIPHRKILLVNIRSLEVLFHLKPENEKRIRNFHGSHLCARCWC